MRPPKLAAMLLTSLIAAACSASESTSESTATTTVERAVDTTQPTTTLTESDTTEPSETGPVQTDALPPDAAGGTLPTAVANELAAATGSMTDLLDSLPLAAYDAAIAESRTIQIDLLDVAAASEAAGLQRPSSAEFDASFDWAFELTQASSVGVGGSGFAVLPPTFVPDPTSIRASDEIEAELGFSFFDVDQSATLFAPPMSIAVVTGSTVELSPELIDLGGGIVSAGNGEDFEIDAGDLTASRSFGQPMRLAANGSTVAASFSTPLVEAWLDNQATMLDEPRFATAVAALDEVGVVFGFLIESDFASLFGDLDLPDAVQFSERFSVVGIGVGVIDGTAANVIVYVFDDDDAARETLPEIDGVWRTGEFLSFQQFASDLYAVSSVEQRENAVVVTATVTDQATSLRVIDFLFRGDPIFSNR